MIELKLVQIENEKNYNFVIGMSHFIMTAEDMSETLLRSVPNINFGLAFCEASGPALIRLEGNNDELIHLANRNAANIAAGHSFILFVKDCFPINFLSALKNLPEVTRIFTATANPVQVIITETSQGRGILGVIDGFSPQGTETDEDRKNRFKFLRDIGYKLS